MSDRNFEPMTKADVVAAQRAWAKCVTEQDVDGLLDLYDFGDPDAPLLFKPTLADVIRHDRKGARAYFVGGDPNYPNDHGFLKRGWTQVDFHSAVGAVPMADGRGLMDMGHYTFLDGSGRGDSCRLHFRLSQAWRARSDLVAPFFSHVVSTCRRLARRPISTHILSSTLCRPASLGLCTM